MVPFGFVEGKSFSALDLRGCLFITRAGDETRTEIASLLVAWHGDSPNLSFAKRKDFPGLSSSVQTMLEVSGRFYSIWSQVL